MNTTKEAVEPEIYDEVEELNGWIAEEFIKFANAYNFYLWQNGIIWTLPLFHFSTLQLWPISLPDSKTL